MTLYSSTIDLIQKIDVQMPENLIARMDGEFDRTLEEPDHKLRSKMVKAHNRNVKEVSPVSNAIYPLQIRFTQIKINLIFLLENACYNRSYEALSKYFAEYDFLSQTIKKECKKANNNQVIKDFLDRSTVLEENFFQVLMETIEGMKHGLLHKMHIEPEIYIDLDIEKDSSFEFDEIKSAYKNHIKKLKEDLKKNEV